MPTLEVNIHMENRKVLYTKYYITATERKRIISDCGDAAALLLEYIVRLAAVGDREIQDQNAADYFGWSLDKVRRVRRSLIKHGWFAQKRYRIDSNTRGVSYYIGQNAQQMAVIPDA